MSIQISKSSKTDIDTLLTRLTALRAGYLDELATANIPTDLSTIDDFVDDLETRLTATRAGYLDYLASATYGLSALKTLIDAVQAEVDNIDGAAMRGTDSAALASVWTSALATALANYTAARAGYIDNIDDAVQHTTNIFPADTNLLCTLTAGQPANTYGAWAEVADSGATTFSSLFAATAGHISSIVVETISDDDAIYMVEISYGDAKTVLVRARFAGVTKFQAPNVQNRMWPLPFPAGETIYYRMKTATAVADTCTVHFRYHLHA